MAIHARYTQPRHRDEDQEAAPYSRGDHPSTDRAVSVTGRRID